MPSPGQGQSHPGTPSCRAPDVFLLRSLATGSPSFLLLHTPNLRPVPLVSFPHWLHCFLILPVSLPRAELLDSVSIFLCVSIFVIPWANLLGYRCAVNVSSLSFCVYMSLTLSSCCASIFSLPLSPSDSPVPTSPFSPPLVPTLLIQFQLFLPLSPALFSETRLSHSDPLHTLTRMHTLSLSHSRAHLPTPLRSSISLNVFQLRAFWLPPSLPPTGRSGHQGQGLPQPCQPGLGSWEKLGGDRDKTTREQQKASERKARRSSSLDPEHRARDQILF